MVAIDREQSFSFPAVHTQIIFGFGVLGQLAAKIREIGGSKVLVVTDAGVVRAGVVGRVSGALTDADIPHRVFSEVPQDSSTRVIDHAVQILRADSCDVVVAVGGGSALDAGKAVALAATNPSPLTQYAGLNKVRKPGLPMIAIPTTAGTGSEVSYWSVMTDDDTKLKISVGGELVFPRVALCDPELTLGLPPLITATTGMDALTHAVESYVNKSYQPISEALTWRAIELIGRSLLRAVSDGSDREARYEMLLGSTLAGIGMNPTRLGIVHALAMPLGSWHLKIPHGTGNAVLLPHVMEFNRQACPGKYAQVSRALGVAAEGLDDEQAAVNAVECVRTMSAAIGIPRGLRELGLTENDIPRVCAEAMKSGNIAVNPRACVQADLEAICRAAL
jgi:alcohol dehydrogenase